MSLVWLKSGYTGKYSLSPWKISCAPPSGLPLKSGYISQYIPSLVTIQIQSILSLIYSSIKEHLFVIYENPIWSKNHSDLLMPQLHQAVAQHPPGIVLAYPCLNVLFIVRASTVCITSSLITKTWTRYIYTNIESALWCNDR